MSDTPSRASNPPAGTVDELMGWVNQEYQAHLPRAADLEPGTSLPALWAAAVTYQDLRGDELVNARVSEAWKDAATGMSLSLALIVGETARS